MSDFKSMPWTIVVTLATCSLFGQERYDTRNMSTPMMPGYNASSRIAVRRDWDVYSTASFIYWNPLQENLELGIVSDTAVTTHTINGNVVDQDFSYTPGFRIGMGMNLHRDGWDIFGQYTWLRNTDTASASVDPNGTQVIIPFRGIPATTNPQYHSASETWKLSMDLADFELARAFYVGTELTVRPFCGVRGAWIRQYMTTLYIDEASGILAENNIKVEQLSHSWALGPRAGLYANWMLGQRIRMYGNGAGDLLFTQYTTLGFHQEGTTSAHQPVNNQFDITQHYLHYIRTHLELEFGFGWGMYLDNHLWHIDVSAGYGFQVYFDQNMFRNFTDDSSSFSHLPNGNLYIHGMTFNFRFDY